MSSRTPALCAGLGLLFAVTVALAQSAPDAGPDTAADAGPDTAADPDAGPAPASDTSLDPEKVFDGSGADGTDGTDGADAGVPVPPRLGDPLVGTPPLSASTADREASGTVTAAWLAVGGSVAFLTAGTVLALSAQSREDDIQNLTEFRDSSGQPSIFGGSTRERYDDLVSEGKALELAALASFVAAGACAGAAAVLFLYEARRAPARDGAQGDAGAQIVPLLSPERAGMAAEWKF